jgi:hypothetical protein
MSRYVLRCQYEAGAFTRLEHLPSDFLKRYSVDKLTETEITRTEEHLLLCQLCRDRLDDLEESRTSIKSAGASDVASALALLSRTTGRYEAAGNAIVE